MADWKERVEKLLNLSQSDSDGEALSAIRMANKILKENKSTWSELLQKKSGYSLDHPFSSPQNTQDIFSQRAGQAQADWMRQQAQQGMGAQQEMDYSQAYMNQVHAQTKIVMEQIINDAERSQDGRLIERLRRLRVALGL